MCENCDETGHEIARYRRLAFRITNQQVLDGMAQFIKQLQADKAAIRCRSEKKQG